MSIAEALLPEFDTEFADTRKFLALVPNDKLTWKPHEKSMELGKLAWHLSDFSGWGTDAFKKDVLEYKSENATNMANEWKDKTREKMLERFDTNFKIARESLWSTSDEKWPQRWRMVWDGRVFIDETRMNVYRKWVMSHMVHHRAQLGLYLHLNEIAIPELYDPSANGK